MMATRRKPTRARLKLTRAKNITRARAALTRLPASEIRNLTAAEKARRGLSPGSIWITRKGAKYRNNSAIITRSRWRDAHTGVSHTKAAKIRKEARSKGIIASDISEAPFQSEAAAARHNRKVNERLRQGQYAKKWPHSFVDRDGQWQIGVFFSGAGLIQIQEYERASHRAEKLYREASRDNRGKPLSYGQKDRINRPLRPFEGGIVDADGTRQFPSTDIEQILDAEDKMTRAQRRARDEVKYLGEQMGEAA
jgi:hypothetical protein